METGITSQARGENSWKLLSGAAVKSRPESRELVTLKTLRARFRESRSRGALGGG